jgi:hypothetical protein
VAFPDRGAGAPADPSSSASWRVQAEARFRANTVTFGKAEAAERASLEALQRIKP